MKAAGVPRRLVPVPEFVSPDCGICFRYDVDLDREVLSIITGIVEYIEIRGNT